MSEKMSKYDYTHFLKLFKTKLRLKEKQQNENCFMHNKVGKTKVNVKVTML